MSEISDWFQNNWIDLARLVVQGAILAAVVRYGRKVLAALRASQEQVGALLKLSVSDTVPERSAPISAPIAEPVQQVEPQPNRRFEPATRLIPQPEPEPEPEPVFAGAISRGGFSTEREQSLGGRVIGSPAPSYQEPAYRAPAYSAPLHPSPVYSAPAERAEGPSLTPWVSAPITHPASEAERASAPAAAMPPLPPRPSVSTWLQAPMRSSGVSPWRKMVRWLQAPAGH